MPALRANEERRQLLLLSALERTPAGNNRFFILFGLFYVYLLKHNILNLIQVKIK